ncbi:MAG: M16 family metallopeptidase [bacterium]|jgi:zinc protease
MNRNRFGYVLCLGLLVLSASFTYGQSIVDDLDIPFQKFVLDNGLTLIVHEDHKAPIVAVNVWYHVGSRDEKPGKTGFAHLFEHLMFNGSEHYDDDYFKLVEPAGATDLNGTTSNDRTNYFQTVPTSALDLVLWLESDRMGFMKGAINQEKLDEQRGVVQNEKRQRENVPYGKVDEIITVNTYPKGHPYSWTVIGSMDDLNAASLEDVHEWFDTYYGAANAFIAIAGDVDAEEVKEKVEKYFGNIPSGPPLIKQKQWIAKRSGEHRLVHYDRVPQSRVYKVWNTPGWGMDESLYLDLFADVLASGKNSRLYKRLVYEDQVATSVSAFQIPGEIGGQFYIIATARPGEDLKKVEQMVDEEFQRLLKDGPTEQELQRVKMDSLSGLIKGMQRIGGFGGKSDILVEYAVYGGDPGLYKKDLKLYESASVENVKSTAQEWLSDGVFVLEVYPYGDYQTLAADVDRSKLPEVGETPEAEFPKFQRKELANGLDVLVAERHDVPVVELRLVLDIGYAADHVEELPGLTRLAMDMLDEGTENRSALEISEQLELLGASIFSSSNRDVSSVGLSALTSTLDDALEIFADVVLNPTFDQKELERLKKLQLAAIQQEKQNPTSMASRVLPALIYGKDHAYGLPASGSGNEESVQAVTAEHLTKFHQNWFKPNHATVIVVGDTTMEEMIPKLEKTLQSWEKGEIPEKNIHTVESPEQSRVYILNRPAAESSVVVAAHLMPPKANPDEIPIEMMNTILGGSFSSRINMNLREDKHWSYGAGSSVSDTRGPGAFVVSTSVQMDKTSDAMKEILREIQEIRGDRPPSEDELEFMVNKRVLQLTGGWETLGSVAGSIQEIIAYDLPEDYWEQYPKKLHSLSLDVVSEAAGKHLKPESLIWVIVGDQEQIEPGIRELGFGEVTILDTDGNEIVAAESGASE